MSTGFPVLLIPLSDKELAFSLSQVSLTLCLEVSFQFFVILALFKLLNFTLGTSKGHILLVSSLWEREGLILFLEFVPSFAFHLLPQRPRQRGPALP